MKWLGGILVAFGFMKLGEWQEKHGDWGRRACGFIVFTGAVMAGEGASAIPLGGTLLFLGGLEHAGEEYGARRSRIPTEHHWEDNIRKKELKHEIHRGRRPPKEPRTPEDFRALARQLESVGNYRKAAENYEKSAKQRRSLRQPIDKKEIVYRNREEIAKDYFKAGENWEKAGNISKAIKCYRNGLKFMKTAKPGHENIAKYSKRLGDLYFKQR